MHAIELQQQDPESILRLVTSTLELRRKFWEQGVFTANDGGSWRVEAGNLLICERVADFFVAVAEAIGRAGSGSGYGASMRSAGLPRRVR